MNSRRVRGQSLLEYVMLIAVVAGLGRILSAGLPKILKEMEGPFKDMYVRTYKYGDPKACGYENDPPACSGPARHPRIPETSRLFARGRNG